MSDVTSLVVSDILAARASSSAIDRAGDGDILFCDWDTYLHSSFEETIWVFDFNLWGHTTERSTGQHFISEHRDRFRMLFENFGKDLRYLLRSGDVVIVLDSTSLPLSSKSFSSTGEEIESTSWTSELGLYNNREFVDRPPEITTDIESAMQYLFSAESHYSYQLNADVVTSPLILANSPSTNSPAGFVTQEIQDANGDRISTDGSLVMLPQPDAYNKPHDMMRTLVNLGWHFHEKSRPEPTDRELTEDKTSLSIPLSELDDELIENSWTKYARGEYRDAAARACQHLEYRVRELTDEEMEGLDGSDLMKQAFSPSSGPLSMGERRGEEEGVMFLYAGAIQGLWNPLHHRPNSEDDVFLNSIGQQEAHDILSYVNFLLGLLPEDAGTEGD